MEQVRKILLLPTSDRLLLAQSVIVLTFVKLGLWLLPFRTMRKLLGGLLRPSDVKCKDPEIVERVGWAIAVISRRIPLLKNCLTEAIATQILLKRTGHPSILRIGVARSEDGQLKAHAWVEVDGVIITGGSQSPSQFVPLPPLENR